MDARFNAIMENKWWQEVAIFVFTFSLFAMKNDWILFRDFQTVISGFVYFLALYIHAQSNRFFLLPLLFKEQRPYLYILLTAVLILLFSVILYQISTLWIYKTSYLYQFSHQKSYVFQVATLVGTLICIIGPSIFLKFYREQKKQNQEALLLKEIQLNSLRSQLNPHFLFNTFNTLYGISLEFPERTPDLIMKVSRLMRYQLESNSKQCVTLEEELSFINSYIQLEKERVGYRCDIRYSCEIDSQNAYKIAPMLLIAFIENAFKHGSCTIENCYVHIKIAVIEGQLSVNVSNSVPVKKNNVVSTKIGIKNTTERLKLIYGKEYSLDIKQGENLFTVDLLLPLKKNTIDEGA